MLPKLLIHIGYPKTGTTWLQENLFGNKNNDFFLISGKRSSIAIDWFLSYLHFNWVSSKAKNSVIEALSKIPENKIAVLSEETLIGDPAKGRYQGQEVAKRIHSAYPSAKILITIREQRDAIMSSYREYVLGGGTFDLNRFIGVDEKKEGFLPICQFDFFKYDAAVGFYKKLFGDNNVHVMMLEVLKEDPVLYSKELYDFMGIGSDKKSTVLSSGAVHVGIKGLALMFLKWGNRYVPQPDYKTSKYPLSWRTLMFFVRIIEKLMPYNINKRYEDDFKDQIDKACEGVFNQSNKKLTNLLKRNLPDKYNI